MSTLKVDTLNGSTGSTITVPSGQTLTVAGTLTTSGTFNPTADITVTGNISNDGIQIADNEITATRTNDDLILATAGSGKVSITGIKFPSSDGSSGQVIQTDGSGNLSFATISSTSISQNNTNVTVSDTGSDGTVTISADGNTELTVTDAGVRVHGNLTVDGTQTIINTATLSVEDNIIEVNRNVSANAGMPTLSGLKRVTFAASPTPGTFQNDEVITGGTSGAKGKVVNWDSTNRILKYIQTQWTGIDSVKNITAFAGTEVVTGATSSATATMSAVNNPEIAYHSGDVMYVENRVPITRASDQTENIKLIVEF